MAKKEGIPVVIADIQQQRVSFATKNGFADHGIVVPIRRGHDIEKKLQIAKETAQLAWQICSPYESSEKGYNVVFECTGVEASTQAAIYVSGSSLRQVASPLTLSGRLHAQEARSS